MVAFRYSVGNDCTGMQLLLFIKKNIFHDNKLESLNNNFKLHFQVHDQREVSQINSLVPMGPVFDVLEAMFSHTSVCTEK